MAKKIGVVRVLSDDLPSQAEGWVEMSSYVKRKHLPYLNALSNLEVLGSAEASADEKAQEMVKMDRFLAVFIEAWNWKDRDGKAYPQPAGNPEIFGELMPEECNWLIAKTNEVLGEEELEVPKQNDTPS